MATQEDKKECDLCGYITSGKFTRDVPSMQFDLLAVQQMQLCTISATKPPEECAAVTRNANSGISPAIRRIVAVPAILTHNCSPS